MFVELKTNELISINGGADGWKIVGGILIVVGGVGSAISGDVFGGFATVVGGIACIVDGINN